MVFHTPVRLVSSVSCQTAAVTGVGADDIQPPELRDAVIDGGLQRRDIAHVRLAGDDPAVQRLDRLDRLGQVSLGGQGVADRRVVVADVHRDDVRALLGQPDRVTAPLPAGRPGDERDLAFELPHDLPSSSYGTHLGPVGMPGYWPSHGPGNYVSP